MPTSPPDGLAEAKQELRERIRRARRTLPAPVRQARDEARTRALLDALDPSWVVALYASVSPEPDTLALLQLLLERGPAVLLPVLSPLGPGRPRRDPAWAWCASLDDLRPGLWGIPEPGGQVLGPAALAEVDLVLAPGLAVGLDGSRLGTGGGWYDRALQHRRPGTPVWVLVDETELAASVPHGPRDVTVDAVATSAGVLPVGRVAGTG